MNFCCRDEITALLGLLFSFSSSFRRLRFDFAVAPRGGDKGVARLFLCFFINAISFTGTVGASFSTSPLNKPYCALRISLFKKFRRNVVGLSARPDLPLFLLLISLISS